MTEADEKLARQILEYIAKLFPDRAWVIRSRDELLAAIAYVETLD